MIKGRLENLGSPVLMMSPAEFRKFIAEQTERWAKVIKYANIRRSEARLSASDRRWGHRIVANVWTLSEVKRTLAARQGRVDPKRFTPSGHSQD